MTTREIDPARPEPAPENAPDGHEIVPQIIREINQYYKIFLPGNVNNLFKWLNARSDFGFKKYGVRLTYPNKRNWLKDLADELVDGCNYARGALKDGQISESEYIDVLTIAAKITNRIENK